ncbi:MAG: hypothetical protein KDE27_17825 [Planctomycetes bacterium]|nr:hypothetical protein [Planctomycetota bacterium]
MMHRGIAIAATLLFAALVPIGPRAVAQDPAPTVSKQELARTKFRDLTERMQGLMLVLQKNDADANAATDAGILMAGTQYVQEAKIHEHMALVRQRIEQERWDDETLAEIAALRDKLVRLAEILQNRNDDLRELLERIAQLEKFKDRVDQLAQEQADEKEDSARAEALQKLIKDAEQKRTEAQALLQQQKAVRGTTNELGMQAAAQATKPLADKEAQLQDDTAKLAEDLAQLEAQKERLDAEAKKADGEQPQPAEPGKGGPSGAAKQAAGAMGKAGQKLGDNQPEPSLKDQDHAIENLEQTVEELDDMIDEARRELLKLPFEDMAKRQEKTKHATDTLSKDMEQAEEGENGEKGQPTPGKKRVQQAVPKQRSAAGTLKEFKPAKQDQQDAKENLEAASKELEEALAQLRQQLQDEVLRALEERFTEMLAIQRELTIATAKLDETRKNVLTADGSLPASLAEQIGGVATGEGDLEVEASDALKLLEEEGTTAVFPEIVEGLQEQLHEVAGLCREHRTDPTVQEKQKEVEDTLELLINALRRTVERKEGGC